MLFRYYSSNVHAVAAKQTLKGLNLCARAFRARAENLQRVRDVSFFLFEIVGVL